MSGRKKLLNRLFKKGRRHGFETGFAMGERSAQEKIKLYLSRDLTDRGYPGIAADIMKMDFSDGQRRAYAE